MRAAEMDGEMPPRMHSERGAEELGGRQLQEGDEQPDVRGAVAAVLQAAAGTAAVAGRRRERVGRRRCMGEAVRRQQGRPGWAAEMERLAAK